MISICFILLLFISILTSSYGQVTCASGWVFNGGKCYTFYTAHNNWDQCHGYCPTSYPGAMMLCVNNAAEQAWISSRIQFFNGGYHWIGFTDMLPYGGGKGTKQYGWVTGCSSTYTNWRAGEPSNQFNNEDYAIVDPYNGGQWYDESPQSSYYCGCEYNPALTKTPSSRPTTVSSSCPSTIPSFGPTVASSSSPTAAPSSGPTVAPSFGPTVAPSSDPTAAPSSGPTSSPTATPSFRPSVGAVSE